MSIRHIIFIDFAMAYSDPALDALHAHYFIPWKTHILKKCHPYDEHLSLAGEYRAQCIEAISTRSLEFRKASERYNQIQLDIEENDEAIKTRTEALVEAKSENNQKRVFRIQDALEYYESIDKHLKCDLDGAKRHMDMLVVALAAAKESLKWSDQLCIIVEKSKPKPKPNTSSNVSTSTSSTSSISTSTVTCAQ